MNDLVAPFVFVFLLERCEIPQTEFLSMMSLDGVLDTEAIFLAEADAYWCLTALLDSIQDYYTFAQPGIQKRVHYLEDFIARVVRNQFPPSSNLVSFLLLHPQTPNNCPPLNNPLYVSPSCSPSIAILKTTSLIRF